MRRSVYLNGICNQKEKTNTEGNIYNTESYVLQDKTFLGHLAHLWD